MRRIPGGHEPNNRNRSSKHLVSMTKCKPAVKSMSNAALSELNCAVARKELKRRADKQAKKDAKVK